MRKIIFWTWCLPQSLLGLFILIYFKVNRRIKYKLTLNGVRVYSIRSRFFPGVGLSAFIFMNERQCDNKTFKHEYGHVLQGFIFGPLYLLAIGIPSLFNNLYARINSEYLKTYYEKYPEKWADELGKVRR